MSEHDDELRDMPGDAAALIRAYLRRQPDAFDVMIPGEHDQLLLFAFGMACTLAQEAAGGLEPLDAALQRVIEHYRG